MTVRPFSSRTSGSCAFLSIDARAASRAVVLLSFGAMLYPLFLPYYIRDPNASGSRSGTLSRPWTSSSPGRTDAENLIDLPAHVMGGHQRRPDEQSVNPRLGQEMHILSRPYAALAHHNRAGRYL